MQTENVKGQNTEQDDEMLDQSPDSSDGEFWAFNPDFTSKASLFSPNMNMRQSINGFGAIAFLAGEAIIGLAHGASWAWRRLRR